MQRGSFLKSLAALVLTPVAALGMRAATKLDSAVEVVGDNHFLPVELDGERMWLILEKGRQYQFVKPYMGAGETRTQLRERQERQHKERMKLERSAPEQGRTLRYGDQG